MYQIHMQHTVTYCKICLLLMGYPNSHFASVSPQTKNIALLQAKCPDQINMVSFPGKNAIFKNVLKFVMITVVTRQAHTIKTTSYQRRCDVMSHRR